MYKNIDKIKALVAKEKEEPEAESGKKDPVDDEKPEENTGRENTEDKGNDQGSKSSGSGSGNVTITDIVERARVKSGAPNAVLDSVDPDGTLNIRLYGSGTQDTWDWYYINPSTLKGTNILGNPVNLE